MSKEKHLVTFHIGARWKDTTTLCPQCKNGPLKIDKLSKTPVHYKCLRCGYEKVEEDISKE